jgi:hypothetical protein
MEGIATYGARQLGKDTPVTRRILGFQPKPVLCSATRGRERWYVDALEDNPRFAAAVELVLRGEEGILNVRANALTGRVLVHYRPDLLSESIETMLRRALEFGPLSREEFLSFRPNVPDELSFGHLVAAEIGCFALKLLFAGGCCPLTLGAAALMLLMHRHG